MTSCAPARTYLLHAYTWLTTQLSCFECAHFIIMYGKGTLLLNWHLFVRGRLSQKLQWLHTHCSVYWHRQQTLSNVQEITRKRGHDIINKIILKNLCKYINTYYKPHYDDVFLILPRLLFATFFKRIKFFSFIDFPLFPLV